MEAPLENRWRSWRAALALVALVTALRLVYVGWFCPYALIEDEAYYWLWSRHLDWSYTTKGPGIALSIAGGVGLLGDITAGVRMGAPVWGAILALCVAGLAGELAPIGARGHTRFWGAAITLLTPPLQAMAVLMLIDGPLLACWAGAMWAAVRAMHHRGRFAWLGLGAAIGVGMLFKPVVLLLAVGLVVHATLARRSLRMTPGWGWWLAVCLVLAAMSAAPIVAWNARHDWMTVSHLLGHVGAGSSAGVAPTPGSTPALFPRLAWMGEYLALQVALGGVGLAMGVWGAKALLGRREDSASPAVAWLCVWSGVPVYSAYLAVSAFTRVEANWALPGLIGWLAIGGAWAASPAAPSVGLRLHLRRAAVVVGVVCGVGMLRLDLLARLPVLGPVIPIGRLTAGPNLAESVQRLLHDEPLAKVEGRPVLVLTDHYGSASQIAFYLNLLSVPARVTCATGILGRPPTQFDLWPETRADDERLIGQPAILIGSRAEVWESIFTTVHDAGPVSGDHKRRRAFIGIGYRGGTRGTEAAGG